MNEETIKEKVMAEHLGDHRGPIVEFLYAWPLRRWVLDLMTDEARNDGAGEHFSVDEAETVYDLVAEYFPHTLERIEARWERSLA